MRAVRRESRSRGRHPAQDLAHAAVFGGNKRGDLPRGDVPHAVPGQEVVPGILHDDRRLGQGDERRARLRGPPVRPQPDQHGCTIGSPHERRRRRDLPVGAERHRLGPARLRVEDPEAVLPGLDREVRQPLPVGRPREAAQLRRLLVHPRALPAPRVDHHQPRGGGGDVRGVAEALVVDIGAVAPGAHRRGDARAVVGHRRDAHQVYVKGNPGGEGALLGVGGQCGEGSRQSCGRGHGGTPEGAREGGRDEVRAQARKGGTHRGRLLGRRTQAGCFGAANMGKRYPGDNTLPRVVERL